MFFLFFFNDTATTEIYTLSLHDALPTWSSGTRSSGCSASTPTAARSRGQSVAAWTSPPPWSCCHNTESSSCRVAAAHGPIGSVRPRPRRPRAVGPSTRLGDHGVDGYGVADRRPRQGDLRR